MKTFIVSLLLACTTLSSAQTIVGLKVLPPNPTTNDPVIVLAECVFPYATCYHHTKSLTTYGNIFYGYALHCLGMLTALCGYTDTFHLGLLPAGSYQFWMGLQHGFLPAPCSPATIGAEDSIGFTVSLATHTPDPHTHDFTVLPNPCRRAQPLSVSAHQSYGSLLILRPDGSPLAEHPLASSLVLPTADWSPGIYFMLFRNTQTTVVRKLLVY